VGSEITVALAQSEAGILQLFAEYHLLEVLLLIVLLSAPHLLKAMFRLLRSGGSHCFDLLTFVVRRWYRFKSDVTEARIQYERSIEGTKKKPTHSVQRIVLASDGQSPSKSPLPT
jgi:hypothetical protein